MHGRSRGVNRVLARKTRATLDATMKPDKLRKLVGERARQLRKDQGMSGPLVGNLLNKSRQWVSDFEHGRFNSTLESVNMLAEVLGVDEVDLFTFPEAGLDIRHTVIDLTRRASEDTLMELRDLALKRQKEDEERAKEKQRKIQQHGVKAG